jgi:prepilin-type N-terminal cleavage/methylation domain-containing protein/prepilin-type processing-associated H-X9-DG protein
MRRGFTLIELLVVIAIIAILAAILFPVFARARAKAQQNNCLSNVKQLQLGLLMYANDYDGCVNGYTWEWINDVYPYVKNVQIYRCPSAKTNGYTWTAQGTTITSDYGQEQHTWLTNPHSYYKLTFPAEKFEIWEDNGVGQSMGINEYASRFRTDHNDGANFSFCDGHVKWLSGNYFIMLNNAVQVPTDPNYVIARHFWYGED